MLQIQKKCIIITTINRPEGNALRTFSKLKDYDLIIAGDSKSPKKYDIRCSFISVRVQKKLFPDLFDLIPVNHYARKNFGYLYAIKNGYDLIVESDDDNYPGKNWFVIPPEDEKWLTIVAPKFPNVYSFFGKKKIWPRGYPLNLISKKIKSKVKKIKSNVLVWQGLVNLDPDVDAIYRLIFDGSVKFLPNKKIALDSGVISPFNSQNTAWKKGSHYLLYIPFSVNFRYSDILRSFVAQFGLWALGGRLGFVSPNAEQKRNAHDLLVDFIDEVQMHTVFYTVIEALEKCQLTGCPEDLLTMYKALRKVGVVSENEIKAVKEWLRVYYSFQKM